MPDFESAPEAITRKPENAREFLSRLGIESLIDMKLIAHDGSEVAVGVLVGGDDGKTLCDEARSAIEATAETLKEVVPPNEDGKVDITKAMTGYFVKFSDKARSPEVLALKADAAKKKVT